MPTRPRPWPARRWATGAVVLALLLLLELAPALGLERLPLVAAALAPRNAVTVALAAAGVALLAGAALAPRARRALLPLAIAAAVAAGCGLPAALAHGFRHEAPAAPAVGDLRILSWNINGALVQPEAVAEEAARQRADVVVLPEITPAWNGAQYATAFRSAGLALSPSSPLSTGRVQAVVFVARRLGTYRPSAQHSAEPDRSAAVEPTAGGLPRIVAIHAVKPLPGGTAAWNADLAWVARLCADPATIAVGDFNATVDHFPAGRLGGCADAALARGAAGVGTWPTALPTWLGMPIDHVLVGRGWTVRSFSVLTDADRSGARHRPILAVVRRAGA